VHPRRTALLWTALGLGFAPVLVDLARNLREDPRDACTLLAPLLLAAAWWRRRGERDPSHADGLLLLSLAVGLELAGLAGGAMSLARLGLPLAVLGMARWCGAPPLAVALLALGVVPVPQSVLALTSPQAEAWHAALAAGLLGRLGADVAAVGPTLRGAGAFVHLGAADSGLLLAIVGVELGWFSAVARRRGAGSALRAALLTGLVGLALQPVAVALAAALVAAGRGDAAGAWLAQGAWASLALLFLGVQLARRRHAAPRPAGRGAPPAGGA